MKYRWINKNVNLDLLINYVAKFFGDEGFKININKLNNDWIIFAAKFIGDSAKNVFVRIHGRPNDFYVEFSPDSRGREVALWGHIATFFGLGFIVKQEAKWMQFFENLERKFWIYMNKIIIELGI